MTDGGTPRAPAPMRDLGQRIASAAALAFVVLAALWVGGLTFATMVGAIGVVVAWEWGRIVRQAGVDAIMIIQAIAVAAGVLLAAKGLAGLGFIAVVVAAIISALLAFGERGHMAALGALYAGLPAVALVWLNRGDAAGFLAVLFLLLTVWATDTGAYFAGRLIGGHRLMPSVSPNKTWSGLAGGIVAGGLVGLVFALARPELSARHMIIAGALLAVVSQAGDLLESALKREYGVKDASALIPGHGGFMDRIDGLAAAVIAAAIFAIAVDIQAPARALLGLN
ncbi:MAG: phosphatidate cytidylyltransferase [Hyphomicrobium sp.]|uniref:phosphatidate cytidylyltransferase n=1 Tax=Hyphomicrobium sp. CS1BSMeth3 TaxID=1892844 RepID=UPI000A725896|nr:phosphatidate cytidylyltransferase [Hyphomicrobium sp. CS1BSMeth3]MBN9267378.1 phosphatidate cytidylyltransferase [Hyphomicrobium sp.]MBN9277382.1 phosphatidate cytidylyltransferase [Hyphomicrobium sp.]